MHSLYCTSTTARGSTQTTLRRRCVAGLRAHQRQHRSREATRTAAIDCMMDGNRKPDPLDVTGKFGQRHACLSGDALRAEGAFHDERRDDGEFVLCHPTPFLGTAYRGSAASALSVAVGDESADRYVGVRQARGTIAPAEIQCQMAEANGWLRQSRGRFSSSPGDQEAAEFDSSTVR